MLALEGDYYMATIVIYGGAQYDAYENNSVNLLAQNSCGRIVVTDSDPTWEMDTMPLNRNMGEMVMLPTGVVVIINGAQAGLQGFGLATDPSLNPFLYEPDELLGSAGNSNRRPVIVKAPKSVVYGSTLYNVFVTVLSNTAGNWEVNFASAPYSTYSFSQGQRLVKMNIARPVLESNGQYRIVFEAPPSAEVAPPGYYTMFVVNQGVPSVAVWIPIS
ncbi:hypothetical protein RHMOL_Rhmol05G0276400 [Rhododendron molle]|uniref:Uncharacterized protein n=1 Tax=Rhododendron molle TaxID=49168 RepID=A0ACC0NVV0_RHOML|nr:hypothetical protein RHMOL_Rhmol05G0276400 [Rhododendron molle]